jgi:biotin transport system substrate-specific component
MRDTLSALGLTTTTKASVLDQARGVVLFTALIFVGAKIYIPHDPVPFTLQTLFVVLAGAFLGWRKGVIGVMLYLALGALGIPVFAGPVAGPSILLGTTAGYLFGFVLSAGVVGAIINAQDSFAWTAVSMFIGFILIFATGTFYLNAVFIHNWTVSITQGLMIFSYWDLIKLAAAVGIYRAWARVGHSRSTIQS